MYEQKQRMCHILMKIVGLQWQAHDSNQPGKTPAGKLHRKTRVRNPEPSCNVKIASVHRPGKSQINVLKKKERKKNRETEKKSST